MDQGNDGCAPMKPKRGSWTKEQKRQIVTESHLHVRPKFSCATCQQIVQATAPNRPIARGRAGP